MPTETCHPFGQNNFRLGDHENNTVLIATPDYPAPFQFQVCTFHVYPEFASSSISLEVLDATVSQEGFLQLF